MPLFGRNGFRRTGLLNPKIVGFPFLVLHDFRCTIFVVSYIYYYRNYSTTTSEKSFVCFHIRFATCSNEMSNSPRQTIWSPSRQPPSVKYSDSDLPSKLHLVRQREKAREEEGGGGRGQMRRVCSQCDLVRLHLVL